ncbi:TonB-dependent receptor [Pelagibacteraceae bacterium]|nr:TonB-dependent receptor [Pelagibacteraceae bacterium]
MLKKILKIFIILVLPFNTVSAADIPIIVIAPSKKAQSVSTVGTSVTVLDETFFKNSNELFLGDALSTNSTSTNFFQSGGHGQTSAIQLRGMPKRYSTVYIDGVKMSDPASPSNDFNFNHILTKNIARVEILKGNQSSVYGSGAIGGTINITTKKGEPGFQKNIQYNNASHGTHNLSLSLSGADDNDDFYVGIERFQTDGMSAMTHNDEEDRYRNNTIVANYGRKFSDKIKFESNLRVAETYSQYDKEVDTSTADHSEELDALQSSANISLVYEPNSQFTNKFTLSNAYIERIVGETPNSGNTAQDNYYGTRYGFMYTGNYNFNLDNSVVFGFEREDDKMGYNKNMVGRKDDHAYVTSTYFDYQSRVTNNIYATFGSRFDEHKHAGNEDSHRATLAYLFDDKTTKLKSSYGTGFRFPSLYELNWLNSFNASMKAETSESFDFGIEKSFLDLGLSIDASYFNIKYNDTIEGWKGPGSWESYNFPGVVKSQGLELVSKWKKSDKLNFDLNYTYTSTYDGAEQDDPDKNESYYDARLVRVPRNMINLITNMKIPGYKNLDLSLSTKWSDNSRDYGNGNRTWRDESLDDYLVNDLSIKYNLWNSFDLFFDINNILDEKYETVRDYSQMDRSYNFGIRRSY